MAIGLSLLLFISLMSLGAPVARGDQPDEVSEVVTAQPTAWSESPRQPVEKESPPAGGPASSTTDSNEAELRAIEQQEATDQRVAPMAVAAPGTGDAVITVKVGGVRTGPTTVGGLQGVTLGLYANQGDRTPVADFGTCVSDEEGDCSFIVPDTGIHVWRGHYYYGVNYDKRFWVKQISAPEAYYASPALGTGERTPSASTYAFRTWNWLRAGNTYRSSSAFMTDSGNNGLESSGGIWQNSLENPELTTRCGIDVGVVLDLSNSVTTNDLAAMQKAATGFVDALSGTPSTVGVFTFATNGPATAGHTLAPVSVASPEGADRVKEAINSYRLPGGWAGATNWDRGFYQVVQSGAALDLVVIITDGSPTYYANGVGPGSHTRFREVEQGIFSANAIKATGARVIAFGVGDGVESAAAGYNLRAISGPTQNTDYFQTTDYDAAGAQLEELAPSDCEVSVSVTKQVIPVGGSIADASPAGGWEFTGQGATGIGITGGGSRITDGNTGAANFPLAFDGDLEAGPVTLTETPRSGYALEQVDGNNAVCKRPDTGEVITPRNVANGFTIDASPRYSIDCTVYNRALTHPQLSLMKVVDNGVTGATHRSADWTLSASNGPTPISGPGNSPAVTSKSVGAGTYTLSESGGPDGYSASTWTCSAGTINGSTLTLDHGDKATCTITNTAEPSTLTLVNTVTNDDGGTARPGDWTLGASGPTAGISGPTGSEAVTGKTVKVGTYTLSESGSPNGYTPGAWNCDGGALSGSAVTVGVGENVTCSINNDDQPHIHIQKLGMDPSGTEGELGGSGFEVHLDKDGIPSDQSMTVTRIGGRTGLFEAGPFEPGSYWLLETKAPGGYSLLAEPVAFTFDREGTLTLAGNNLQATINPGDPLTIRIADVAAIPLPLSGGAQLNLVVFAMVVLGIGGFGVVLIRRQRPQRSPVRG